MDSHLHDMRAAEKDQNGNAICAQLSWGMFFKTKDALQKCAGTLIFKLINKLSIFMHKKSIKKALDNIDTCQHK